ncbi:TetR/AcrR family transcriptional regulator [Streptomyces sp. A1-5]|uniref:TetR/AcrR family transcriptional regulator n=1 Tax=Streptomyces sp. A1-5 TaxID=2738410 RepID=UPI001F328376|nr:TetR/AcrR family transcriptional regulator [Streptomyces sp. A1-5]UJB40797.1 TetR/AcrR family transcriptional regulator [Streptomyces sp. A1-5]
MRKIDPAKHRARRRHIVHTAAQLFAAKGFERTTTAEICKAAGMSSGNLFHYFPNKRAIFHAIFEDDAGETGESKAERLARAQAGDDPWEALLEVVDLLTADAMDPVAPPLVMEAVVQVHRDPELDALLGRDNALEHTALTTLLTRAAAAGQIDPALAPHDAATWVQALIASLYSSAAADPAFKPAEQLSVLHLILQRFLQAPPHRENAPEA